MTSEVERLGRLNLSPDAISSICGALKIQTSAGKSALMYALEHIQLLDRKQQDYGSKNISDFGAFGVVVRMNDKLQRLRNLLKSDSSSTAKNESIEDTFLDISNYGLIGRMVHNGDWPNE